MQTVLLDAFAVGVYHKDGLATVLVEFIVLKGLLGQSDPHSKDHFVFFVPLPLNETLLKGLFDNLNGVLVSVELCVVPRLDLLEVLHALHDVLLILTLYFTQLLL